MRSIQAQQILRQGVPLLELGAAHGLRERRKKLPATGRLRTGRHAAWRRAFFYFFFFSGGDAGRGVDLNEKEHVESQTRNFQKCEVEVWLLLPAMSE